MAGLGVPPPNKLKVKIMDGEVIVHWKSPVDAPSDSEYNVQVGKYVQLQNSFTSDLQCTVHQLPVVLLF